MSDAFLIQLMVVAWFQPCIATAVAWLYFERRDIYPSGRQWLVALLGWFLVMCFTIVICFYGCERFSGPHAPSLFALIYGMSGTIVWVGAFYVFFTIPREIVAVRYKKEERDQEIEAV